MYQLSHVVIHMSAIVSTLHVCHVNSETKFMTVTIDIILMVANVTLIDSLKENFAHNVHQTIDSIIYDH